MEDQALQSAGEQDEQLRRLASESNDQLEAAGLTNASHAFNLGCSASLLPVLIIILLVFLLSKQNWVAVAVATTLSGILIVGLANLAAYVARGKAIEQTYQIVVKPDIERALRKMQLERSDFTRAADETLPASAVLRRFLPVIAQAETGQENQG